MDDREPFGIRIGPNGPIVTGKSTTTQHPTTVTDADAQTHTDEAARLLRLFLAAHKTGGSYDLDIIAAQVETVLNALADTRHLTRANGALTATLEAVVSGRDRETAALATERDAERARADTAEARVKQLEAAIVRINQMPLHQHDTHWCASSRDIMRAFGDVAPPPTSEQIAGLLAGMAKRAADPAPDATTT
jgi:hypothetical protein